MTQMTKAKLLAMTVRICHVRMYDANLRRVICVVLWCGDMRTIELSPSSRGTLERIIGQSVIQNGLVMALVSVVVSLYVIGLQRVRLQPRPSDAEDSFHETSTDPHEGRDGFR